MRVYLLSVTVVLANGGCACNGKEAVGGSGDTDQVVQGGCAFFGKVRLAADSARLEASGCGEIVLDTFTAVGDGDLQYTLFSDGSQIVVEVRAGESGGTLRAFHAEGSWWAVGDGDPVVWRQGYQSWSASGIFALDGEALSFDADGLPIAGGDNGVFEVVDETPSTSWWVGLVGRADGVSLAAGAVTSAVTRFYTAFEADRIHLVWGGRGEEIPLDPGASIYLDPVWLGLGDDASEVLRRYAASVADSQDLTISTAPVSGWGSWNQYYEAVTEEDIRSNLAAASMLSAEAENGVLDVIEIDDGWQRAWGDWSANDAFPSGMGAVASEISAAGFVPGIWMAPFHVDRGTTTYSDNLDWFLHVDGVEVDSVGRAVLDTANPDARAWMAAQVADRVSEGYAYVKLDFLFAGALEGDREPSMTGVAAYKLAMAEIRDAVGAETWILACGAPMLPSVGHADSWRSGPDIAFALSPDPDPAFLRNQVRSTAARGFANGLWWWNDPDVLLVREPTTAIGVSGATVANAIAGGVWILGDSLDSLPVDRAAVALNAAAMATTGGRVTPVNPLGFVSGFDTSPVIELAQGDDRVPTTWVFSTGETALLNLGDQAVEVEGPGGTELLSGASTGAGPRTLEPGEGELWQ